MNVFKSYHPITAMPFLNNETYREIAPCDELKPYIRCFWGTERQIEKKQSDVLPKTPVIPDTCMDIIFDIDFAKDEVSGVYCGIDDRCYEASYVMENGVDTARFAIRFFAWSAVLFSEESMRDVKNESFEVEHYFSQIKKELAPQLCRSANLLDQVKAAEQVLLRHIHLEKKNVIVLESVEKILEKKGNIEINRISKEVHVSSRQLERLFKENTGITPKKLALLIKYQYLWNDIVFDRNFCVLDAVYKYGYVDQAHLLHDFKKFHTMTISEAKAHAWKDVGFLQEER